MPMLKDDYQKTEKINGVIYNMSLATNFRHGIVNGNIYGKVREGLKDNILQEDKGEKDYNADTVITLREFPHIAMTLGEIFDKVD